ncbi:MAG: STAS domain-containing protein [Burkholderiales bacterium]
MASVRIDGDKLVFEGAVTMLTAPALLQAVERAGGAAPRRIDMRGVSDLDSAGVALILQIARSAESDGAALPIEGAPPALAKLVRLYGVDALFALA